MNRYNGNPITDEVEHIKQSVADILTTQIGTRIQRRDYGSNVPKLIDRTISPVLMLQIAAASVTALSKWEPRLQISQFRPHFEGGKISVTIKGTRTNSNKSIHYDNLLLGNQ